VAGRQAQWVFAPLLGREGCVKTRKAENKNRVKPAASAKAMCEVKGRYRNKKSLKNPYNKRNSYGQMVV
jgi:hypothetical protein